MLTILDVAKNFNEFIKTFIIVINKFSSFAKNYYLSLSILTQFEFFRRHFEVFDKHFDVDAFEYITLKKIIIYDIVDVQKQFAQMIQTYFSL